MADVSPSEEGLPEVQDTKPEELELPEVVEKKATQSQRCLFANRRREKWYACLCKPRGLFMMWFDGANWKITDKTGGGKLISLGKAVPSTMNGRMEQMLDFIPTRSTQKMRHFVWLLHFKGPRTI